MRDVLTLTNRQVLEHGKHLVTLSEIVDNDQDNSFTFWCSDCNTILDYVKEKELDK